MRAHALRKIGISVVRSRVVRQLRDYGGTVHHAHVTHCHATHFRVVHALHRILGNGVPADNGECCNRQQSAGGVSRYRRRDVGAAGSVLLAAFAIDAVALVAFTALKPPSQSFPLIMAISRLVSFVPTKT